MYNTPWIDRAVHSGQEIPAEESALRATFQVAQKIAYQLVCASNQLAGVTSPDVNACASLVREAIHKPEKQRAAAVKAAKLEVLKRQVDFVSTCTYFQQYNDAWTAIRPVLVAELEAVALPDQEAVSYAGLDFHLNLEAVALLIEECDIAINEANKRLFSNPTIKHAETAFQELFEALVAEVTAPGWLTSARFSCCTRYSEDIFRDLAIEKISSTHLPDEYVHLKALYDAREAFERAFCYDTTSRCRDFQESTRGTFNDTQLSEALLAAVDDLAAMQRIEADRDSKLLAFGRKWRNMRLVVDNCQELFVKVAELLPEAVAEAAAIEDEKLRRQAQNLCLFAARRLKENLRFIRECDRWIGDNHSHPHDLYKAAGRGYEALVERIKSKEIRRPTTRCRPEPYCG